MNTPSKEALEAAKEFRSTVVGLSNDSADKLAAIIDRHIEPLRQRAEQAEQKARDWETAANLYQLDFQTEAARAEQAEARVTELEECTCNAEELRQLRADNSALRASVDSAREKEAQT